jgi:hypothetical protein
VQGEEINMPDPLILALTLFYLWNILLSVFVVVVAVHGLMKEAPRGS